MAPIILQSMTGYADIEGTKGDFRWRWQARSVNGKGLDVRLRLPAGLEHLEQNIRKVASRRLKRGHVQLSLAIEQESGSSVPRVNEAALEAVLQAAELVVAKSGKRLSTNAISVEGILALRGVLEITDEKAKPDEQKALEQSFMDGLAEVIDGLHANRAREGQALGQILSKCLDQIQKLTSRAEKNPSRSHEAIHQRLQKQISQLLDTADGFDRDRLYQEAVILATKADIREELDRLFAHIDAARDLLASQEPVGRRLDFLAIEFNREVNTLCSKSNANELTTIGLELKILVDQFREQIQNIE